MTRLHRRQVLAGVGIAGVGAAAAAWGAWRVPAASGLVRPSTLRHIAYLIPSELTQSASVTAFVDALGVRGWIEGQTLTIEWGEGHNSQDRILALAKELARPPNELIVTTSSNTVRAACQATTTLPIVTTNAPIDPVAEGWAASWAHPGGNLTGVVSPTDMDAKRVEVLHTALPWVQRIGVLFTDYHGASVTVEANKAAAVTAAQVLGLEPVELRVEVASDATVSTSDLAAALDAALSRGRALGVQALLQVDDARLNAPASAAEQVASLTLRHGLPGVAVLRQFVVAGGLMSYGPSTPALYARAASYVDRILQGEHPGDLPIERGTALDYLVNTRTARELGVTISPDVAPQVTEWVQ